jgi:hypothetical protein
MFLPVYNLALKKKGGWGPSPCHPLFGSAYGY